MEFAFPSLDAQENYEISACFAISIDEGIWDCFSASLPNGKSETDPLKKHLFNVVDQFCDTSDGACDINQDAAYPTDSIVTKENEDGQMEEVESQDWQSFQRGLELECNSNDICTMKMQFVRPFTTENEDEDI